MKTTFAGVSCAVACAITLCSCAEHAGESTPQQAQRVAVPEVAADQTYSTRGRVSSLVVKDSPATEFRIHHEPITEFVDRNGEVVGMSSHAMTFPYVIEGVQVDDLEVGDLVAFTFEVRWNQDPRWVITSLERLPEGTELSYGKAILPGDEQPSGEPTDDAKTENGAN